MLVLGPEVLMMSGGMRGAHMGMESSMRLGKSCCPSYRPMRPRCAIAGFRNMTYRSRPGSTLSLGSGIASTM